MSKFIRIQIKELSYMEKYVIRIKDLKVYGIRLQNRFNSYNTAQPVEQCSF